MSIIRPVLGGIVRNGLFGALALLPTSLFVFLSAAVLASPASADAAGGAEAADPLVCTLIPCTLFFTHLVIPLISTWLYLARYSFPSARHYLAAAIAINWGTLVVLGAAALLELLTLPMLLGDPAVTRSPVFAANVRAYLENMAVLTAAWYTVTGALAGTAAFIVARGRAEPGAA